MLLAACSTPTPSTILSWGATTISVGETSLEVVVADTPEERAQGLMDVSALDDFGPGVIEDPQGMIFLFEEPRIVSFTMKNTLLPLDIWFIDASGVIVGSAEMVPCPEDPCVSYRSPAKVLSALETPLGQFDFAIGDAVSNMPSS